MQIALLLFHGLTALDAIGPLEVLARLPEADVALVAHQRGIVRASSLSGSIGLVAERCLDEIEAPDVLVVPGGLATRALVQDEALVGWIARVHPLSAREAQGTAPRVRRSREVDARVLPQPWSLPPEGNGEVPGPTILERCVMLQHERPPVSRVREIRMHGLKGGLDFNSRGNAVVE